MASVGGKVASPDAGTRSVHRSQQSGVGDFEDSRWSGGSGWAGGVAVRPGQVASLAEPWLPCVWWEMGLGRLQGSPEC